MKHLKPASQMKKCEIVEKYSTTLNSLEWVYITETLKWTYRPMHYAQY